MASGMYSASVPEAERKTPVPFGRPSAVASRTRTRSIPSSKAASSSSSSTAEEEDPLAPPAAPSSLRISARAPSTPAWHGGEPVHEPRMICPSTGSGGQW